MTRCKWLIFALAAAAAGCQGVNVATPPLASPVVWASPTFTPSPVFPTPAVTITASPAPTATPIAYTIVQGDTFLSIAAHFGISVDALRAANPNVGERTMSIGQVLVIPLGAGGGVTPAPSPTPVPLRVGPPRCYRQASGGEWCLVLVTNDGSVPVTGIFVRLSLYPAVDAQPSAAQDVALPLAILPAGVSLPAAAFFPPSEFSGGIPRAELLSAYPSTDAAASLPVSILTQSSQPLDGGLEVTFDCQISENAAQPATRLEAVLTLVDAEGNPLGFRILRGTGTWQPGDIVRQVLQAYPLGGTVDRYELQILALP